MFRIDLSQRARKFLDKLDNHTRIRIESKLKNLSEIQIPPDAKYLGRISNEKVFRVRIGDYRALYKLKEKEKIVIISKIDKRPRVYK